MGYRLVRKPFVTAMPGRALYGPGRYNFGSATDWWLTANSEPTDDTSIPLGHVEVIGTYDGLPAAYARLERWIQSQG